MDISVLCCCCCCMYADRSSPPPLLFLFLSLFCIITKDQIISDGAWLVGWQVGGYVNGRGGVYGRKAEPGLGPVDCGKPVRRRKALLTDADLMILLESVLFLSVPSSLLQVSLLREIADVHASMLSPTPLPLSSPPR